MRAFALGQLPCQGMFAATRAEHQNIAFHCSDMLSLNGFPIHGIFLDFARIHYYFFHILFFYCLH